MTGVDAGRELCLMLADPARPYRQLWEVRGPAYRGRALNQTAVNKVIAAFLVDAGVLAEFEEAEWPRARRDWVRARLAGDVLTHLELELFMDAFALVPADRDRLRQLLERDGPVVVPGAIRLAGLPDRSTYAVERSVDEHAVGPTGLPERHRTTQTVRALVDGVPAYLYLFDASAVSIEVSKGGRADAPRQVSDDIWASVITFDEPLAAGASCDLTYETSFAYREPPPPVLRRAAPPRGGEIEMTVSFHPDKLPRAVHLSTWSGIADDEPVTSVAVDVGHTSSVSATWSVVRSGLVGFSWSW